MKIPLLNCLTKIAMTDTTAIVVQLNSGDSTSCEGSLVAQGEPPVHRFLIDLTENVFADKFYLSTMLERSLEHEALLDTAADI